MVSLTSVLILDNVSVKLKDDGDVCITMTPSLSPFPPPSPPSFLVCSVSSLRPSGRTRSTCGRWHEVRTEGAGVEKQTLSRFPCVLLSSVFKEEAGRKNKTKKKKHMTVCIHRFILLWPFLLPLIRWYLHFRARESSQTTTVRLHSHLDWLQRNQVRKAINQ